MNSIKLNILATAIFCLTTGSTIAQDTIWINSGEWMQSADTMPALRFNASAVFDTVNTSFNIQENNTWALTVINTDSVAHTFTITTSVIFTENIPAGEEVTFEVPALPFGTYRYYSSDERGEVLGLSGLIKVGINSDLQFHWNLADWMPSRMDSAAAGNPVDWNSGYIPRYFSINSHTYPNTANDPLGTVTMNLGDTCIISIVNGGFMEHVLHFHGFHVEILAATVQTSRVGWIKDTHPINKGEGLTLQLVAAQTGVYPVHNHNLVAVTTAGFYPGGMLTMITVQP